MGTQLTMKHVINDRESLSIVFHVNCLCCCLLHFTETVDVVAHCTLRELFVLLPIALYGIDPLESVNFLFVDH